MKVVIDPNVVVSAALKNKDPEAVLRAVVAHADGEWIVSAEILAKYKAVLARAKFGLPPELLCQWITFLETDGDGAGGCAGRPLLSTRPR
jgi:predicted nucleic acid-binding protein